MAVPVKTYNFPDHINGDTFEGVGFTVLVNTVALNLAGAVIRMQLRAQKQVTELQLRTQKDNTSVVLELNTTNGNIIITDEALGKFQIKKQIIQVAIPETYYYDIEIRESNGDVHTYIEGSWKILPDVTR